VALAPFRPAALIRNQVEVPTEPAVEAVAPTFQTALLPEIVVAAEKLAPPSVDE
jgi:hypothetical protein